MAAATKCIKCLKDMVDDSELNKGRCKPCMATIARICRMVAKAKENNDAELVNSWESFNKDKTIAKDQFYTAAKDTFGDDTAKLLTETMREHVSAENEVKLVGTGEFLDLQDLNARYKDKPLRLAAILRNARRFTCPVAEVELIEDMKYESTTSIANKRTLEVIAQCSTERTIKKRKAVVAKKEPTDPNAPPTEPKNEPKTKQLTEEHCRKIQVCIDTIPKWAEKLDEILTKLEAEDSKAWKDLVPGYVSASTAAMKLKLAEMENNFKTMIDTKEGNLREAQRFMRDSVAEVKECTRRAKVQMDEAAKMQLHV